ncbi:conserved protein of unknown function [Tenacibaculum sp. 190130A14a]|uniref:Late embryogenesis abundant protein LEA-2 subgroup domain-containing protein n=2 Tax=Tenacibaculum polynesiense TaxID=3137857 RepID=A0ABM9P8R0_9FLAO
MVITMGFSSCVKDINLDQVNDFNSEPRYIASLVYFKIPALGFLDSSNNEITTSISDETRLDLIEEEVFQKYLKEVKLDFEISNPFDRNIQVELQFLDEANGITYQIGPILIPAKTAKVVYQETISVAGTPQFLNSRNIKVLSQLITTTGSPIEANNTEEFEFKSAGTFTFQI